MSTTVIPARAAIARAIVRERDALDPDSPERRQLNQRAYESLLRWACEVDLTGLEVWWGNGEYCAGHLVARMQPESSYINGLAKTEPLKKLSRIKGLAYPCNNAL